MKCDVVQTRTVNFYVSVEIVDEDILEDEEKLEEAIRAAAFDEILGVFRDSRDVRVHYLTFDGQVWEECHEILR